MSASPLQAEKRKSALHLLLALAVVLFGVRAVGTGWALVAFPAVVAGACVASSAFGRLMRLRVVENALLAAARQQFAREFRRSTLPRQVYWLLLAVAEIDGEATPAEQELVRRFVLERFVGADLRELADWAATRLDRAQVPLLAASIRSVITAAEAETILFWACLVAFADQQFNALEHETLQDVARGLRIDSAHARRIFLHAKHSFLGHEPGGRRRHEAGARSRTSSGPRQRALEILGLDAAATYEHIRKRHRELVKAHHPDRHRHLGAKAAQEAAVRFREVQAAYELLTAAGS